MVRQHSWVGGLNFWRPQPGTDEEVQNLVCAVAVVGSTTAGERGRGRAWRFVHAKV